MRARVKESAQKASLILQDITNLALEIVILVGPKNVAQQFIKR